MCTMQVEHRSNLALFNYGINGAKIAVEVAESGICTSDSNS